MPALSRAECNPHPKTLAAMHDCYRPLLVFAASADDSQLQAQISQLQSNSDGSKERQLLLVPILLPGGNLSLPEIHTPSATFTPEEEAAARSKFHQHSNFEVVLLGKDGGEKLRSTTPISFEKLQSLIDAMPMRQQR